MECRRPATEIPSLPWTVDGGSIVSLYMAFTFRIFISRWELRLFSNSRTTGVSDFFKINNYNRYAMDITVKEGGEYFRGLLLLVSRDRKITEPEISLMMRIGKALGLAEDFCGDAIREILENKFILDLPPEFSSAELAKKFIKDGLTLACCDHPIHPFEETWLMTTVEKNGLDREWFLRERDRIGGGTRDLNVRLEADDLAVEYSRRDRSSG